jgi:2-dehydropantoate 2-reductase
MPSQPGNAVTGRHVVLGAGGVGGLLAAALAHQGEDVTIVLRPESLEAYPPWLSLDRREGTYRVSVTRAVAVVEPYDVLWIAVKATQLDRALEAVHREADPGAVVPLLNGIDHVASLRHRFGHHRVVPGTIAVEAERVRPGVIVQRSPFARLTASSIGRDRLAHALDTLQQFGFTCQFSPDETTLLWSKLVFLAPLALTTTAAGVAIGDVTADPQGRTRLERCVMEACAVAVACGAKVDATQILAGFRTLLPTMRSSMQKDVAAGHAPELEAIAGPILREAAVHGIQVPVTQELATIIRSLADARARAGA